MFRSVEISRNLFQSGSETLDVCISKDAGIWEMAFIASVAVA
ncbi:MAG TPA: hypothetical protein VI585_10660 [Candidatus Binatia bacterium]